MAGESPKPPRRNSKVIFTNSRLLSGLDAASSHQGSADIMRTDSMRSNTISIAALLLALFASADAMVAVALKSVANPNLAAAGDRVRYAVTISNSNTVAETVSLSAIVPTGTTVADSELTIGAYCNGVSGLYDLRGGDRPCCSQISTYPWAALPTPVLRPDSNCSRSVCRDRPQGTYLILQPIAFAKTSQPHGWLAGRAVGTAFSGGFLSTGTYHRHRRNKL